MSSDEFVVEARGLCKAFLIYARPVDRLRQMFWRGRRRYCEEFWALCDVDLSVRRGETVGVVGRNGSGKSTLLQLICGTLTPSGGQLAVRGRVAALLELGAGFNPEFTGRENIRMNAALMGMSTVEIDERFAEIVAFADVGVFLDQPVKTYSSGMFARVAFATAVNVDPDILIVDEALSVGDEAFQRKCFVRIQQLRESGTSVLFVSHSAGAIIELCDRALLLDAGELLAAGAPKHIVSCYQKLLYAPAGEAGELREAIRRQAIGLESTQQLGAAPESDETPPLAAAAQAQAWLDPNLVPQTTVEYVRRGATISQARIVDPTGQPVNVLRSGHTYRYCYRVRFERPAQRVRFGMLIKTVSGVELAGMVSHPEGQGMGSVSAGDEFDVSFTFRNLFAAQSYFANAGVTGRVDGEEMFLHRMIDVLMFRVQPSAGVTATGMVDCSVGEAVSVVATADLHRREA